MNPTDDPLLELAVACVELFWSGVYVLVHAYAWIIPGVPIPISHCTGTHQTRVYSYYTQVEYKVPLRDVVDLEPRWNCTLKKGNKRQVSFAVQGVLVWYFDFNGAVCVGTKPKMGVRAPWCGAGASTVHSLDAAGSP